MSSYTNQIQFVATDIVVPASSDRIMCFANVLVREGTASETKRLLIGWSWAKISTIGFGNDDFDTVAMWTEWAMIVIQSWHWKVMCKVGEYVDDQRRDGSM